MRKPRCPPPFANASIAVSTQSRLTNGLWSDVIDGVPPPVEPQVGGHALHQDSALGGIEWRGRHHHEFELVVGESERHGHAASSGLRLATSNSARSPCSHCLVRVRYLSSLSSSSIGGWSSSIHHAHGRVPGAPR
jgi:hypothetical protein